jgi:hypothetical protein
VKTAVNKKKTFFCAVSDRQCVNQFKWPQCVQRSKWQAMCHRKCVQSTTYVYRSKWTSMCPLQKVTDSVSSAVSFFSSSLISNQSTRYSMSWCAGWLTWWVPLQRGDLLWIQSLLIEVLALRRWGFYLKSKSTNYPDHGHHGDHPLTRKIPMVEPGIEPGTSWLVARSSEH